MFKHTFGVTVFALLSAAVATTQAAEIVTQSNADAVAPSPCQVAALATVRTDFPQVSKSRGEHGDVVVMVTINKDGRATRTHVAASSGYPRLDKAAGDSITKHWRFDVSRCLPTELPTESLVTVQFQRAPQNTVSGTINTRRTAAVATSGQTPSRCDTAVDLAGDKIVACVALAPLSNSGAQQSMANRSAAGQTDSGQAR